MANWCSNVVWFEADETTMQEIKKTFLQMAEKEKETDCGQLPPFIEEDRDWFFDIRWETEDTLYYETRWSPNTGMVMKIADYYKVGFVQEYAEPNMNVFGRATFENGLLTDSYLEEDEFDSYEFDEESCTYRFEEETYHSDIDILEILLERKTTRS